MQYNTTASKKKKRVKVLYSRNVFWNVQSSRTFEQLHRTTASILSLEKDLHREEVPGGGKPLMDGGVWCHGQRQGWLATHGAHPERVAAVVSQGTRRTGPLTARHFLTGIVFRSTCGITSLSWQHQLSLSQHIFSPFSHWIQIYFPLGTLYSLFLN